MIQNEDLEKLKTIIIDRDSGAISPLSENVSLVRPGEEVGSVVIAFLFRTFFLGVEVCFFEVEPRANTNNTSYEVVIVQGSDLFFSDGDQLAVVWR